MFGQDAFSALPISLVWIFIKAETKKYMKNVIRSQLKQQT